jgi:hypothetical protein
VWLLLRTDVPPKSQFLQEPHGVTSQKTPFFMLVTDAEEILSTGKFINTCAVGGGTLALTPQANYTDEATAAKLVPTSAGRGVLCGQRNASP